MICLRCFDAPGEPDYCPACQPAKDQGWHDDWRMLAQYIERIQTYHRSRLVEGSIPAGLLADLGRVARLFEPLTPYSQPHDAWTAGGQGEMTDG